MNDGNNQWIYIIIINIKWFIIKSELNQRWENQISYNHLMNQIDKSFNSTEWKLIFQWEKLFPMEMIIIISIKKTTMKLVDKMNIIIINLNNILFQW